MPSECNSTHSEECCNQHKEPCCIDPCAPKSPKHRCRPPCWRPPAVNWVKFLIQVLAPRSGGCGANGYTLKELFDTLQCNYNLECLEICRLLKDLEWLEKKGVVRSGLVYSHQCPDERRWVMNPLMKLRDPTNAKYTDEPWNEAAGSYNNSMGATTYSGFVGINCVLPSSEMPFGCPKYGNRRDECDSPHH